MANQAILKLLLSDPPITPDGAISVVGDFVDPPQPEVSGLIEEINGAIDDSCNCRDKVNGLWLSTN